MSTSPSKRQRQSGSFSPASPPYHLTKHCDTSKAFVKLPDTPTSPQYMSSTSLPHGSGSSTATQRPASTAAMTAASTLPTPAHSIAGGVSFAPRDVDGDAQMADGDDNRRSDHDRQGALPLAERRAYVARLQADAGPLYKLCEKPHAPSRPHASQNLISLYSLDRIASSVARKDPATGEKINRLRKSYDGQIKSLQLAGRNKSTARPGEFTAMLARSDEDWHNEFVYGKDLSRGLTAALAAKMDHALRGMAGEKLSPDETQKWRGMIGTDDGVKAKVGELAAKKQASAAAQHPGPVSARPSAAPSPAAPKSRPERAGAKRRYNEASFKGYGEGYMDDDMGADTTDGGEDVRSGGIKKKRRKDLGGQGSALGFGDRGGAYNMPIGVRR